MTYINTPLTRLGNSSEIITLGKLFPVGSIYLGTTEVCPMQILMQDSVWEKVSQDRVLQGAGSRGKVDTTLNESLPNIRGAFEIRDITNKAEVILSDINTSFDTGAFETQGGNPTGRVVKASIAFDANTNLNSRITDFNASRSSSTYKDNAPVQQNAYLINVWHRIA